MVDGTRRYRCDECGGVGETTGEAEWQPRHCDQCGVLLLKVTWLADDTGGDDAGESPDGSLYEEPGPTQICACEAGGVPAPDDPGMCCICGGARPVFDVKPEHAPDSAAQTIHRSCLLVLADGRRMRVGQGILVGRRNPSDAGPGIVAVQHPTVSRTHAWLRETSEGVEVVDLASTNGTWVEEIRLEALRIHRAAADRNVSISFGRGLRGTLEFD